MASTFKELTVNMCSLRKLENALHSERVETWAVATGSEGPPLWIGFHLSSRVIHQIVGIHSNVRHVFDSIQAAESCKSRHESL